MNYQYGNDYQMKNKINNLADKQKQKSVEKKHDLDLHLYLDFQKELVSYRSVVYSNTNMTLYQLNELEKIHNNILERLAKRLKVPLILETLKK